ncbi:MAG: alpha/beta fold hydrolase [Planctomycetota bacterium]
MNEQVFQFGPNENLIGVLNRPDNWNGDAPVALMLNAGIVHRVGPFRLHVDLARSLAKRGFASLRLDLSGLGDSAIRTALPEGTDRATLDVLDAMNALETELGSRRFVPIGLCSGAYNAHQVAVSEARIAGGVFLDGIVYETEGHRRRKRQQRLGFRFLRNAVKKRIGSDILPTENDDGVDGSEFFTNDKPAEEVASEIKAMLERDAQLLFLYTQGYQEISGAEQFAEMFGIDPNGAQLQVDYYANFEHTFRLTPHRSTIVDRISSWFADRFPTREPVEMSA